MNKYIEHLYVIPEDDKNRQIADGFVNHHRVRNRHMQVMPIAKGWPNVLETFKKEYVPLLHNYPKAHVAMLIDFEGRFDHRWKQFQDEIPVELRPRVFVIGSSDEPEILVRELKKKPGEIGLALAADCAMGQAGF